MLLSKMLPSYLGVTLCPSIPPLKFVTWQQWTSWRTQMWASNPKVFSSVLKSTGRCSMLVQGVYMLSKVEVVLKLGFFPTYAVNTRNLANSMTCRGGQSCCTRENPCPEVNIVYGSLTSEEQANPMPVLAGAVLQTASPFIN